MTAKRIGFIVGLAAFLLTRVLPPPAGMPDAAWLVAIRITTRVRAEGHV